MLELNENTKTGKLNDLQLREVCPTIFQERPSSETSKHYTHIPTYKVINDMRALGWDVIDAQQVSARTKGTIGFQKHLVTFQNDDVVIDGDDGDTVFPRVLLTNSHDGKNAFKFQAGLFRLICSNGLVISDHNFSKLKIRHMGYDFSELKTTINELVSALPLTVESMNKFKQTEIDEAAKIDFAVKAIGLRFGKDNRLEIDYEQLIKPTRKEDEGNDVWSIYNVVQEKLIDGDFEYVSGTKLRKARKIKNFKQDLELNQKLFDLAGQYVDDNAVIA